jgi:hypothetical protein
LRDDECGRQPVKRLGYDSVALSGITPTRHDPHTIATLA